MITIRNENEADYKRVEEMMRASFWNLHTPGCDEHYLIHVMRSHKDFLPELSLVIEVNQLLIGSIHYTKAKLISESGQEKDILTFGPFCILPEYQRKGYGKKLMEESFDRAIQLGYDVIVIFGNPSNYVARGFKCCKRFQVGLTNDVYPSAMLVKELVPNALEDRKWIYHQSSVFELDSQEAMRFDEGFSFMEKKWMPSQEEFYIASHSIIR